MEAKPPVKPIPVRRFKRQQAGSKINSVCHFLKWKVAVLQSWKSFTKLIPGAILHSLSSSIFFRNLMITAWILSNSCRITEFTEWQTRIAKFNPAHHVRVQMFQRWPAGENWPVERILGKDSLECQKWAYGYQNQSFKGKKKITE